MKFSLLRIEIVFGFHIDPICYIVPFLPFFEIFMWLSAYILFVFNYFFFFVMLVFRFVNCCSTIDRIFVQNPKIFWRRRQAIVIAKCVRLSKKYCHFCEKTIAFPKERQTTLNSSTHKISTNNYTIYNIGTSIGECVNVVPVQLNNGCSKID